MIHISRIPSVTNVVLEGDLCGAIYVDRAFKAHVKTFRKYMNSLSAEAEKRFMEKEWETNVKRNFDGTDGPWMVELPQKQQRGKLSALKSIVRDEKSNILQIEGFVDYLLLKGS